MAIATIVFSTNYTEAQKNVNVEKITIDSRIILTCLDYFEIPLIETGTVKTFPDGHTLKTTRRNGSAEKDGVVYTYSGSKTVEYYDYSNEKHFVFGTLTGSDGTRAKSKYILIKKDAIVQQYIDEPLCPFY